jgi:hypothetical protein
MEITQIYECQEILMRAGELQTDEKKECDKLFKVSMSMKIVPPVLTKIVPPINKFFYII